MLDEARPRAGNFDRAPSPTTGETAGSKHRVVIPTTRTPLDKRVSPVRRYRGSPKMVTKNTFPKAHFPDGNPPYEDVHRARRRPAKTSPLPWVGANFRCRWRGAVCCKVGRASRSGLTRVASQPFEDLEASSRRISREYGDLDGCGATVLDAMLPSWQWLSTATCVSADLIHRDWFATSRAQAPWPFAARMASRWCAGAPAARCRRIESSTAHAIRLAVHVANADDVADAAAKDTNAAADRPPPRRRDEWPCVSQVEVRGACVPSPRECADV